MNKDEVFSGTAARSSDFEFNEVVANVFDDMLVRSVPFYIEQQDLIKEITQQFWIPGTTIFDLGCSIGTGLIQLAKGLESADLIGIDNSQPMLDRAKQNAKEAGVSDRINFLYGDLNSSSLDICIDNVSVVLLCWTLQFVRPLRRDRLIRRIYDSLADGGVLIVTDKILTNDSHMNRFFVNFYYDFKKRNGYSQEEILRKREALENVLIPYRVDENFEMFRRNGFNTVETFFQWYNFAGFLCVKSAST